VIELKLQAMASRCLNDRLVTGEIRAGQNSDRRPAVEVREALQGFLRRAMSRAGCICTQAGVRSDWVHSNGYTTSIAC
jgi:hypothetical protein